MQSKWPMVKLSEVLSERRERPDLYTILSGEIPIVAKIGFNTGEIELREESKTKTNMIVIGPGDLVISGINAAKGAIAIYREKNTTPAAATIHYSSYIINKKKADSVYLWYFMRSDIFRRILMSNLPGGIKTEVKPKRFLPVEIPLPPLEEQKRIVAKIELFISRIEEVRRLRDGAIKETRGLLSKISGKTYNVLSKKWGTEKLVNVSGRITDGTHKTPMYVPDGVPFLSVKDITSGKISFSSAKYITHEEHEELIKRARPEKGDVLLTKVGTTGYAKVIDVDREFSIFVSLCLIKLKKDIALPKYVEHMLNSSSIRKLSEKYTRGIGNKNLVLMFINNFPIPLPSLPIQRRVVAYLDSLQEKLDELEELQDKSEKDFEELVPSVLDKAFRGEL